jgi:preprotein translocase subunit SecY
MNLEITREGFLVVMTALQIADTLTTLKGIRLGAGEANPIIRSLAKRIGIDGALLLTKIAILAYLFHDTPADQQSRWVLMGVYTAVVLINLRVIHRLRKKRT